MPIMMISNKKPEPASTKISQSGTLLPPPPSGGVGAGGGVGGPIGPIELPGSEVMLGASAIERLSVLNDPTNCLMKVVPRTI